MELRDGYKKTDIGVIPDDWDVLPLVKSARSISRGASPRPIQSPRWFDQKSSVGWVRISDVTRSSRYLMETTQKLSDAGIRNSRFVQSGSLIMSICATVGRPIETEIDVCIHDGFVVFDQPSVDQSFLYHVLKDLESRWSSFGQTGSQMNLNTTIIGNTTIAVPKSEEEQCAIATVLSNIDALLDGLDRLIAKKRDIKQAAMQQLLTGKTRLPGFEGKWVEGCLGDAVLALEAGVSVNSVDDETSVSSGRILKTSAVANGIFIPTESKTIARYDTHRAKTTPIKNTLLISRMNTPDLVGEVGYVGADYPDLFLPDRLWMARFRFDNSCSVRWLSFLLSTERFKGMIRATATGTSGSMKNISKESLLSLPIRFPSPEEQVAIATILSDMATEIEALKKRRAKTQDLKQAMMQELLTGRTRLV